MKKFFSLVLALVMALSLTTVAWGATIDPATLTDGAVIDLTAGTTYDKLTVTGNVTNVTINGNGATVAGIEIIGAVTNLTLNNITFTADVYFAGGNATNLTVNECKFDHASLQLHMHNQSYPAYTATNLKVTNCVFDGYNSVIPPHEQSSHRKSTIWGQNLNGATFTGNKITNSWYNAIQFDVSVSGDILIEDNIISSTGSRTIRMAKIAAGSEVTIVDNKITSPNTESDQAASNGNEMLKISSASGTNDFAATIKENTLPANAVVTVEDITGASEVTINASGKITAGKFSVLPNESLLADGLTLTTDGVVVSEGGAVLGTKYDMVTTDIAATKTVGVTVNTYAAKAPKDTNKDGLLDQAGNVKYVEFSNMPGVAFVQVNSANDDADYTVYQTGTKSVFGYFKAIGSPFYLGDGVAFYDFGEKCGQYDEIPEVGENYYLFQDVLFQAVDPEVVVPEANLMVGNALTPVVALDDEFVDHIPAYTFDKAYKIVGVKCAECGTAAVIYPNFASVPKADKADAVEINGDEYYVWLAGPGAVVDTETKVESAETFDAGIAMYVGMSVMAAAGSAVVIGKKKD